MAVVNAAISERLCHCGNPVKAYSGRGARPKYCSNHHSPMQTQSRPNKECGWCGQRFIQKKDDHKFCKRKCFYNSIRAIGPISPDLMGCLTCGAEIIRKSHDQKFCTEKCRQKNNNALRYQKKKQDLAEQFAERAKARASRKASAAALKQEALLAAQAAKEQKRQDKKKAREAKLLLLRCGCCGSAIGLPAYSRRHCSSQCETDHRTAMRRATKQRYKARRRARVISAPFERFADISIFRRDGWRCYLCNRGTPEALMGTNNPLAPTLDHVVALANGGTHTISNVKCACRECNSLKSDMEVSAFKNVTGAGVSVI